MLPSLSVSVSVSSSWTSTAHTLIALPSPYPFPVSLWRLLGLLGSLGWDADLTDNHIIHRKDAYGTTCTFKSDSRYKRVEGVVGILGLSGIRGSMEIPFRNGQFPYISFPYILRA